VLAEELDGGAGWEVTIKDWNNAGTSVKEVWDAVVLSSGWCDNPSWPTTEGLEELKEKGLAMHAKWRGPQGCEDKVCEVPFKVKCYY